MSSITDDEYERDILEGIIGKTKSIRDSGLFFALICIDSIFGVDSTFLDID